MNIRVHDVHKAEVSEGIFYGGVVEKLIQKNEYLEPVFYDFLEERHFFLKNFEYHREIVVFSEYE